MDGQDYVIVESKDIEHYKQKESFLKHQKTLLKSGNGSGPQTTSLNPANTRSISTHIYEERGTGYNRPKLIRNGTTLPNTALCGRKPLQALERVCLRL